MANPQIVLSRLYSAYMKNERGSDNVLIIIDQKDIKIWYCLIFGAVNFPGGEFIFQLTNPDGYPFAPPSAKALTPNGLFLINTKICISIGEFHASDAPKEEGAYGWRPTIGADGFAQNIHTAFETFTTDEHGIGIQHSSDTVKRKLAAESSKYNKENYPALMKEFESLIETNPELKPVKKIKAARAAFKELQKSDAPNPSNDEIVEELEEQIDNVHINGDEINEEDMRAINEVLNEGN